MLFQLTVATRQAADGIHILTLCVSAHHELQQQLVWNNFWNCLYIYFSWISSWLITLKVNMFDLDSDVLPKV